VSGAPAADPRWIGVLCLTGASAQEGVMLDSVVPFIRRIAPDNRSVPHCDPICVDGMYQRAMPQGGAR